MDGLQKIEFDLEKSEKKESPSEGLKPSSTTNMTSSSNKKRFNFKKFARSRKGIAAMLIVAFLFLFGIFGVYLPAAKVYKSAKVTYADAQAASWAIKTQNVTLAGDQLEKTQKDLAQTQKDLNAMWYLRFIPIAAFYYSDAYHLTQAGEHGLKAAIILVDSVEPYADVLGLKGQGSFVGGTAQQRIETAVKTIGKITPRIDDISKELDIVRAEIDKVNPSHYPTFIFGKKAKDTLVNLRSMTDQSADLINSAKPLIKILPQVLGEPDEQKYLVLFQNDKELRPTGGFMTAYSIFRLDSGIVHVDRSSDIYDLDATVPNKPKAPRPLLTYLPKVPLLNLRDTNLSPDFKVSMDDFSDMYKTSGGYTKVDGIIALDTHALVAVMDILGDVEVGGTKFTTKIDPRCNCPQVIYMLEVYADQPAQIIKENRKGIIGDLMYAIMNKAFSSSPKQYWGPLFQTMLTEMSEKHVLFSMNNKDAQKGFEGLNAAGRILDFEGDYFHLNEANFGGAKSNMFVGQSVTQDYSIQGDGTIVKTVTVDYKNPNPPSDCNLERGNLCLNAVLRDWFRIYVPKGSELISSKGSEVKVTSYEELGKTVFEGFLTVRPQGAAKLVVSYKLPFKLSSNSSLPLLIQKQGGTDDDNYKLTVGSRVLQDFKLETDKTLNLKLR
jgi:hypothetical protein